MTPGPIRGHVTAGPIRASDISIDLRVRNPWEAIDLGAVMYRTWMRPLLGAWLAVYAPVLLVVAWTFSDRVWLAWLLLWWLKPVFERFLLHVASRAAFGAPPDIRQTLSAWREILVPMPWFWITLGRPFYLQRSYTMPVSQLERQSGYSRRARERVLGRRAMSAGGWLAVLCAHFELTITLSLYVLAALLAPSESTSPGDFFEHLSAAGRGPFGIEGLLVQAAAMTLVAPLFICSGFSLYLNRRTQLEAWDIEVSLRRIEERLARTGEATGFHATPGVARVASAAAGSAARNDVAHRIGALAAAVFAASALLAVHPRAAAAERPGPTNASVEESSVREALDRVLAAPEFQTVRTEKHWRPRAKDQTRTQYPWSWDRLATLFQWLAEAIRAILWVAAIVGGALLVVLLAKRLAPPAPSADAYRPPATLLGMDIGPDSLPRDVAGTASDLLKRGEARAALALLYRAALSAVVHTHRVMVMPGSTEDDVVHACRTMIGGRQSDYFERLVRQWSAAAYAGRPIDPTVGQALCADWRQCFGAATNPAP